MVFALQRRLQLKPASGFVTSPCAYSICNAYDIGEKYALTCIRNIRFGNPTATPFLPQRRVRNMRMVMTQPARATLMSTIAN